MQEHLVGISPCSEDEDDPSVVELLDTNRDSDFDSDIDAVRPSPSPTLSLSPSLCPLHLHESSLLSHRFSNLQHDSH